MPYTVRKLCLQMNGDSIQQWSGGFRTSGAKIQLRELHNVPRDALRPDCRRVLYRFHQSNGAIVVALICEDTRGSACGAGVCVKNLFVAHGRHVARLCFDDLVDATGSVEVGLATDLIQVFIEWQVFQTLKPPFCLVEKTEISQLTCEPPSLPTIARTWTFERTRIIQ